MSPIAKRPPGDNAKLRELVLFICEASEGDDHFGATKLNKLLFYSDFLAYLYLGKAITAHEYQALPQGPAPRQMKSMLDQMVADKEIHIRHQNFGSWTQHKILALREPRLDKFNGDEIVLVERLIKQFWSCTATQISEQSHRFVGWQMIEIGETIPYSAALIGTDRELTEQEKQWAKELEPLAREVLSRNAR